jgi:diguanylate cyclase (GGDEF)-like protein/PAS domain S-box-containing protein
LIMAIPLKVLILEDNPSDAELMVYELRKAGYALNHRVVETEDDYIASLDDKPDIILADFSLPQFNAPRALALMQEKELDIPFIVVTGAVGDELAVDCLRKGATDYILKDRLLRLGLAVNQALEQKKIKEEGRRAEARIHHLNDVLRAVLNVNQLIVQEKTPQRLLSGACTVLQQKRGYCMVWIGLINKDNKLVIPVVHAGQGTDYLKEVKFTWDESETGNCPTGIALRTIKPDISKDISTDARTGIWNDAAKARKFASMAAVPIFHNDNLFGVLNVYAEHVNAFDDEEIDLLNGLASNLAYALHSIQEENRVKQAEDLYRTLAGSPYSGVYIIQNGSFQFVNNTLAQYSGYSPGEIMKKKPASFVHPEDREMVGKNAKNMLKGERSFPYEYRLIRKDGKITWNMEAVTSIIYNSKPAILGNTMDISERKKMEEVLRESEERYRTIIEHIEDGYYEMDLSGRFTFFNDSCRKIFGYNKNELLGMDSQGYAEKENAGKIHECFKQVQATRQPVNGRDWKIVRKDGSVRFVEASISLIKDVDKSIGFRGIIRDITDRKLAEETITRLAYQDSLTLLPNRTLLNDRFSMAIKQASRNNSKIAFMMLDLDKFKEVNDTYGHSVGDQLLKGVGSRLSAHLRKIDTIARMGGDEFSIILADVKNAENAANIAEKIIDSLRDPFVVNGHELDASTSIGIAIYPDDGQDADTLMANSDIAMYRAKRAGGNRFNYFSEANEVKEKVAPEQAIK